MKKYLITMLIGIISSTFYNHKTFGSLETKCLLKHQEYDEIKPFYDNKKNDLPIHIKSNQTTINYPNNALFSGEVEIKYGNRKFTANEVQFMQLQKRNQISLGIISATGNINYFSNEINLKGKRAWFNLDNKDTDVYQGSYYMLDQQGRGNADVIKQRNNNRYTILKNGSFTTCLPGDDSWNIIGSKVLYDREKQIAQIWNARFKIGNIPIFYSPYFQIPIGGKHRSGFFMPYIKYSSKNGVEFSLPYYFNLKSDDNITFTSNYMSERGIQIQTEYRYLKNLGKGIAKFDWLPKDQIYNKENFRKSSDRWLVYWNHKTIIDQIWRFSIDYTKVSDPHYYSDDLPTKYVNTTNGYALQKFKFGYTDENWDISLLYKNFQTFDTDINSYGVLPQFNLTYYYNSSSPLKLKIFSQATKFANLNNTYPNSIRLHIEPLLSLPITNKSGYLNTEAKLMLTHYKQENIDFYNKNKIIDHHLARSVKRIIPHFKIDGRFIFNHDIEYKSKYVYTLEPRLQYLYIPYRNQNNIGIYDSTVLQTDYLGLFRDRIYSGLDRISPANQLSSGITTRIYDEKYLERFNVSVGHIYYLSQTHPVYVTPIYDSHDKIINNKLIWAGDGYWHVNNNLDFCGNLQYNSFFRNILIGNATLKYWCDNHRTMQFHYRYINPKYIEKILSNINRSEYKKGISQMGVEIHWLLFEPWSLIGVYYHDHKTNQLANQFIGLKYTTCCWSINLGYERKFTFWKSKNTDHHYDYDNKISFNIELRGLNNNE